MGSVLGVASPRERLPLDQDRGSPEHPPSSVLFGSSAVEMFTGGSVQMPGVPTPQQKAYDVYEHCPVAVVPWLQSQGTQNSPQCGCDVDTGLKKPSSALQTGRSTILSTNRTCCVSTVPLHLFSDDWHLSLYPFNYHSIKRLNMRKTSMQTLSIGIVSTTLAAESIAMPVVRPEANRDETE